jgi:hypothetical protein
MLNASQWSEALRLREGGAMTEPAPQPAGASRKRPGRGQPTLPERITAPLTPEQLRALGSDDPWGTDEEFEAFLTDLADTRSRD